MPRPIKIALHDTVLFVTTSVEEGFMFPPNPLIRLLLLNCLARAQGHHPVDICHLLVEATHIHMLLYVTNPEDVRGFMERFKTESAHAINRLLGRRKRTLWCEGYDSPVILDLEKTIDKIVYIYENPSKDSLVDTIDHYPGLSSWAYFKQGTTTFKTCLIPRDEIRALPSGDLSEDLYRNEAALLSRRQIKAAFKVSPNAWMKAFKITDPIRQKSINQSIVSLLRKREQEHREARVIAKKSVVGVSRLTSQRPGTPYTPVRAGKRMFCLSSDIGLRVAFILYLKSRIAEAQKVLTEWRRGIFSPYPVGLYPPSRPKIAEQYGALLGW